MVNEDAENESPITEATRAIIATVLLEEKHRNVLRKIFSIMDVSGDGKIGPDEIMIAFG